MNKTHYPRLDETVYRAVLPNGLHIAVVPRRGFSRKAAYLVVDYGSIHTRFSLDGVEYTTPDGVAHYLEHKMFDLPGGRDVTAEFAALGANPNAFTSYDTTAYYFSCTEHFGECLGLLTELVFTPYFTDETVEKERGIIAQEILMYADSPETRVFEDLTENVYRVHPIRVPVSGTVESIQDITAGTLALCHRAFYTPSNMVLCVVGDVEPEQVLQIVKARTPEAPAEKAKPLFDSEELSVVRAVSRRQMDVSMPTFQLGFKCPGDLHGEEFVRWELMAELAAEALFGESSALYLRMYEEGLIDSSFGGGVETVEGTAMLTCGGDSDDPEAVRDAIIAEARRIAREGVDEAAFARMKKSYLGRRVKDLDSFESTCFRTAAYHFDRFDYFRFPELFSELRREDIPAFLGEAVRPERCSIAIVEPLNQTEGD